METVWEKDLSGDRVGGLSGDSLGEGFERRQLRRRILAETVWEKDLSGDY